MTKARLPIGVVFPQTELGADPGAVAAFAQAAEDLGFAHLTAYDHVLGASAAVYDKDRLKGPYRERHLFHEPFVMFGYLAGLTRRIELVTGILILPQRQTALVAKQAAEVDLLSGGRLRLGVGTGWNDVEYEALGVPFANRGARQAAQIDLLRRLWTEPLVEFKGEYDTVSHAGLNPLPVQRPIPIWIGGGAEAVVKRVATTADGWMPLFPGLEGARPPVGTAESGPEIAIRHMRELATAAGRDPDKIGVDCRIDYRDQTPDDWKALADLFRKAGATHLTLVTLYGRLGDSPDAHIKALERMKATVDAD